jgi:hypothetical protein
MAVGFIFEGNFGPEQYEQMRDRVMGGNQLQPGQLSHVAGPSEGGFCVVEIWESPEAAERFYQHWPRRCNKRTSRCSSGRLRWSTHCSGKPATAGRAMRAGGRLSALDDLPSASYPLA